MPSAEQLRSRLSKKLKELFQLDQPDLDFGFYRIMHAKAEQVQEFIENDLLKIVEEAFRQVDETRKEELRARIEREIQAAREYGVPDPENSPKVTEAQAEYNAVKDSAGSEAGVYDHLYRFFERYYDAGDFISRRYYTRETPGKAAPFAVPYNGEEVKLHWANADQYYIKTAEYFTHYTFDLRQTREFRARNKKDQIDVPSGQKETSPLKVHFRIADAAEGEHGNVKATDANKRFFIIHHPNPVEINEEGELVVNFEYRPDPEKSGQEKTWREKRNAQAVETILEQLEAMMQEKEGHREALSEYLRLLTIPAPTEKDKTRPLLARYINQYTAHNTMDYFIHKDLGGFLRRELDFYIKNEVMRLDDIEEADAPAVESYLAKIKVLRKIAGKLIDFLAQLEDFQKKLWLKKKFVVETNYCITLDRVPEELYPDIAANESQREEWVRLFAIDEIEGDLHTPSYTEPLTVEFLKTNDKLVLDTIFYSDDFKARLGASFENFDDQCDGLLIHSENFQALNLLRERYRKQVDCVYIDPPYNAKFSEVLYKNEYKHSSWMTLMYDTLCLSSRLTKTESVHVIAIDENEQERLGYIIDRVFPSFTKTCVSVVHNSGGIQGKNFSYSNEFSYFIFPSIGNHIGTRTIDDANEIPLRDWGGDESKRESAKNCFYPIFIKGDRVVGFGDVCDDDFHPKQNEELKDGIIIVYPIDNDGIERKWRNARSSVEGIRDNLRVKQKNGVKYIVRLKSEYRYKTVWDDSRYNSNVHGSKLLGDIQGEKVFSFPKSIYTVQDSVSASTFNQRDALTLDFFAGSGTTGHAVINLNREINGHRKYILVEMGDYFDTVLRPRIVKVVYSEKWKDGKPNDRHSGISHCFKYIRLESYEDALNNLRLDENPERKKAVEANATLHEDYMLRYMLNVETRGSQSLLNIDAFADPTAYTLDVKKPGSDEIVTRNVDLIETFHFLIGLRVEHIAMPQSFNAKFTRTRDPDLPEDQDTRLVVDGRIKKDAEGSWWFRKIEGWVPMDSANPNNGLREKVLVVWRKLTGDLEKDNLMLDEWFQKTAITTRDFEFDTIYVNGSNNLPNLKQDDENWTVRLIEGEFMKRMWDVEGI